VPTALKKTKDLATHVLAKPLPVIRLLFAQLEALTKNSLGVGPLLRIQVTSSMKLRRFRME
jgi:hypothetical protein